MVQLTTILILIPVVLLMACIVYIAIIGRIGIQLFRYNMPFLRRRGTWYLIRQNDGRFKIVYDKFKTEWEWKDGSKTIIRRQFDKIAQTAEPLVFLEEGGAINRIFGEILPREEQSKQIINLIRLEKTNERLKAQEQYHIETKGWLSKLPLITAMLALITLILTVAIFMSMNDIKTFIAWVQPQINTIIEAIKSQAIPKQL